MRTIRVCRVLLPIFIVHFVQINSAICIDDCDSFFDASNVFVNKRSCNLGSNVYCCGECSNRYCCSEVKKRLNQEKCSERCESYFDLFDKYIPQQTCIKEARFCCGTCHYRDCCPYYLNRLAQNQCSQSEVELPRNERVWLMILGIGAVFAVVILFSVCKLTSLSNKLCRSCLIQKHDRHLSNTTNSTESSLMYPASDTRIYEDSPPAYETLAKKTSDNK